MDKRIQIDKSPEELIITIKALLDTKKQQMLLIWLIFFSICGVAVFFQFFEG